MKYLIMTIMLAMSTVNAGENVASAIDEYIDDNPEVVLPTAMEVPSMPAPNATGITASGNITAPAIAPIVSITPAVLTPPPTNMGKTTSGLSSMYSSIAEATYTLLKLLVGLLEQRP
jgi:hypothetical protein